MHFSFLHPTHPKDAPEEHSLMISHRQTDYSNEGSGFLDDSLLTEDLPVCQNQSEMENNEPLDKALSDLQKKGYREDLNFETDSFELYGGDLDMRLNPEAYHIDAIERIGDESQPGEGEVVYAITTCTGVKGTIVEKPDTGSC